MTRWWGGSDDRRVYRGYLIVHNPIAGLWFISCDDAHVGTVKTADEAKDAIDLLTE